MMKIKEKLSRIVHDAIRNYDFEQAIDNALDEIDIEEIINQKLPLPHHNREWHIFLFFARSEGT